MNHSFLPPSHHCKVQYFIDLMEHGMDYWSSFPHIKKGENLGGGSEACSPLVKELFLPTQRHPLALSWDNFPHNI